MYESLYDYGVKEVHCDKVFLHYTIKSNVANMDKWAIQLEYARNIGAKNAESFCRKTLNEYMRRLKIMLHVYRNRLQREGA